MSQQPEHELWMREAIGLAGEGRWTTCPNPVVGAVLVDRNGQIVARGRHLRPGGPHAEVDCLADAASKGISPAGCTMVVTLVPCNHHGRTPPCTEAIIKAGISRVIYGLADPNPLASGGPERLRSAGIEVIGGVCESECRDLAADFLVWQTTDRPYLILKLAATIDGRIATRTGHSRWISSAESRAGVHALRAGIGTAGGAVLVGGSTFRADDPRLTARTVDQANGPQPLACVLTSRLPAPADSFFLLRERPEQTVFLTPAATASSSQADGLRRHGVRVLGLPPDSGADSGRLSGHGLAAMLKFLRSELACPYVLCEGGGRLALGLLEAGLVDEFHLHLSPQVLGDNEAAPLFAGRAPLSLDQALKLRICKTGIVGGDVQLLLRGVA